MEHGGDIGHNRGRAPDGRRALRLRAWVATGLAIALVTLVLAAYGAYRELFGRLHQLGVSGLGARPARYGGSLNLLVIGSYDRHGKGGASAGEGADTLLVLHLSPGLRRAVVLSIPRDSVVPVLGCAPVRSAPGQPGMPGQTALPGQIEQVNATFARGGPACLWKTIERTTGIRLEHFIEVSYTGFERVINDLGGVRVCLPYAVNDPRSGLRLPAGPHRVTGSQALAYWRVRYIGTGSDTERVLRDQFLLASVARGIKKANLLADPGQVFKVVTDVASSLTTDRGLTQSQMISLALGLKDLSLRAVRLIEVPVVTYPPNPDWVRWAPQAHGLFWSISHDKSGPAAARPTGRPRRGSPAGASDGYGGITADANVCHDSSAFTGPLGGH